MSEMTYVQEVNAWLEENDYVFDTSKHNEDETVFLIYMNAIHQSALLIELTINEREGGTLLCNVAPYIPKGSIAAVNDEMKRLSFLCELIAEFYLDEDDDCSVMAESHFDIKSQDECIFKVISSLDMFKDAVDLAISGYQLCGLEQIILII